MVEAEVFRGLHEALGSHLHAQRGEHRVARDRERERQASSAGLAICVFELHSVQRRRGRIGENALFAGHFGFERRGNVTILKVDPGGCRSSMPMPATAKISPLAGSRATTPPSCPPSASAATRCNPGEMVV